MGKLYPEITSELQAFILRQPMFFVASAPLSSDGHVNVSPKGLDSFRILDSETVVYADMVGSGAETIAHIKENGRVTVMFCAFEGAPKILRLHGRGRVIEPSHDRFEELVGEFPQLLGIRAFIQVSCTRVSDSCGFGVPLLEFQDQRTQLIRWCESKGIENLDDYQQKHNRRSIDGLPGIRPKD